MWYYIKNRQILISKKDGALVGCAIFSITGKTMLLNHILVKREFRSLKIGQELLQKAINLASEANRFILWVKSDNEPAIKLYEKFGYKMENLKNFTYETRASSREFCAKLVEHINDIDRNEVKENIKNQSWFMSFWEQDPSVSSMLNMLDSIEDKVNKNEIKEEEINLDNLTFSLMIISDYGLDDDLYIKMT